MFKSYGGSLIGECHFVTSAHCFHNLPAGEQNHSVTMGGHNFKVEEASRIIFDVESVTIHPEYDKTGNQENDIAIVTLKTCYGGKSQFISTIAYQNLPPAESYEGENVTAIGWGLGSDDILSQAQLTIVSNEECRKRDYLKEVNYFCRNVDNQVNNIYRNNSQADHFPLSKNYIGILFRLK